MTNPERCPKCGAGKTHDNGPVDGAGYECGRWMFGEVDGGLSGYHMDKNNCLQRQIDRQEIEIEGQRRQLQSLAERVKVLESHFVDPNKKVGGSDAEG